MTTDTRTLHLIDIENLVGDPRPDLATIRLTRLSYESQVLVGDGDLVVVASNHGCGLDVGLAYSGARLLWRSGPDGADRALLDVLTEREVPGRFDRVVFGSGDGIFAGPVAALAASGVSTLVVSRPGSLARSLRLAAGGRVVDFCPIGDPTEPVGAVALAQVA